MAYVYKDSSYAPCSFLVVKDGGNPYNEDDTVLIQLDWDFPSLASYMGLVPCECGFTDGTIDCEHKTASEMINNAHDFIMEHLEESFELLDEYFYKE